MLKTLLATTALSGVMISGAMAQTTTTPNTPTAPPPARTDTMTKPDAMKSDAMKSDAMKTDAAPAPRAAVKADSPQFIAAQKSNQMVSSKFKGTDVLGPDDAHIGDVSDILFTKDGQVVAYIVGVGGFLGIGEKNVAIEPTAFQMVPAEKDATDPTNVKLKVSWTKDQLKTAPSFEYYKPPARTTSTGAAPANTGMAPRPAAPAR